MYKHEGRNQVRNIVEEWGVHPVSRAIPLWRSVGL